jgi:hypothetical protein
MYARHRSSSQPSRSNISNMAISSGVKGIALDRLKIHRLEPELPQLGDFNL